MEIIATVCDVCFAKEMIPDNFWKQDMGAVHDCGEVGHFCDEHFAGVCNAIDNYFYSLDDNEEVSELERSIETFVPEETENLEEDLECPAAERLKNLNFEQNEGKLVLNI